MQVFAFRPSAPGMTQWREVRRRESVWWEPVFLGKPSTPQTFNTKGTVFCGVVHLLRSSFSLILRANNSVFLFWAKPPPHLFLWWKEVFNITFLRNLFRTYSSGGNTFFNIIFLRKNHSSFKMGDKHQLSQGESMFRKDVIENQVSDFSGSGIHIIFEPSFGFTDVVWFCRPIVVPALCHLAVGIV